MTIAWIAPVLRPRRDSTDRRARRQAHRRRFALEQFEDRTLLSTFTWTGGAGIWADPLNWEKTASTNSNLFPNAGDTAIIDDASAKVTISGNAAVAHLTLQDGSVTLDDDAKLAISNNLSIGANTTFNASAGTVTFGPSGFSNVTIDESASASFGNVTLAKTNSGHDLTINGTMNLGGDLTINGINLMNGGDIYVGGDVHANDTSVSGSTVIHLNHDATIYGDGALPWVQVEDGAAVTANDTPEPLNLLIKSGSFTASDNLKVKGAITVDEGASLTVPGKLTLTSGSSDAKIVIKPDSAVAVKDLTIHKGDGNGRPFSLPDGELSITGDLAIVNVASMRGGQINVAGNVTTTDATITSAGGEPTWIHLGANGSPHTISGGGALPGLLVSGGMTTISDDLQVVKLNITGGTLKAPAGNLGISWDFTQTGGTFNANGGTVLFNGASDARISIGATKLNNVELDKIPSKSLIIQNAPLNLGGDFTILETKDITGAIHVGGNLTSTDTSVGGNGVITMTGGGIRTITATTGDFPNGGIVIDRTGPLVANVTRPLDGKLTLKNLSNFSGTLAVGKDVDVYKAIAVNPANEGAIRFMGGSNQVLTAKAADARVPGVEINKTGGKLTLNGYVVGSSKSIDVYANWIVDENNQGTVDFNGTRVRFNSGGRAVSVDAPASMPFGDVEINIGTTNVFYADNMTVGGTLTLTQLGSLAGRIDALGDVDTAAKDARSKDQTGAIRFTGGNDQTLRATTADGRVPAVTIEKTGGTLTLADGYNIGVAGSWNYVKGRVDAGDSTVEFSGTLPNINTGAFSTNDLSKKMAFNNVVFNFGGMSTVDYMDVAGNFTITSAQGISSPGLGRIKVAGDLSSSDSNVKGTADITMYGGGTARLYTGTLDNDNNIIPGPGDFPDGGIVINKGSGDKVDANVIQPLDGPLVLQNIGTLTGHLEVGKGVTTRVAGITGNSDGAPVIYFEGVGRQTLTAAVANAAVPGLSFNSTGAGWVTLAGGAGSANITGANTLKVGGGWIVTGNGNVNLPVGSNIKFTNGVDRTINIGNSAGFQNVEFDSGSSKTVTIGKMVVNGNLMVSVLGTANGGDIEVKGDVLTSNNGYGNASGTSNILINGTGNQTLKATKPNSRILGIKIAKTGGLLTIADDNVINVTGNWTYTGNGSDVDAADSTIKFIGGDKRIQAGDMKFGNVIVAIGSANKMSIVDAVDDAVDALYTGTYTKTSGTIIKGGFKLFP